MVPRVGDGDPSFPVHPRCTQGGDGDPSFPVHPRCTQGGDGDPSFPVHPMCTKEAKNNIHSIMYMHIKMSPSIQHITNDCSVYLKQAPVGTGMSRAHNSRWGMLLYVNEAGIYGGQNKIGVHALQYT